MKLSRNLIWAGTICILYFTGTAQAAIFGSDDNIIWESGKNLSIRLVKIEKSAGKSLNDHPVSLSKTEITNALTMLVSWEKEGFFKDRDMVRVFSDNQVRLLGNYLEKGLNEAKSDEDITFVLAGLGGKLFKDKMFVAGRVYYKDKRLNIIIGDYDRPLDKGREAVETSAGVSEVEYVFNYGSRTKASGFKKHIVTGDGIDAKTQGKKTRLDWFLLDVPVASAAYVAKTARDKQPAGADAEAIRAESTRLANERRELRAEMARMRKEMSESASTTGPKLTTEERLAELEELRKKKLISDAEYEVKRKEILDDI
ncbi:MAG: hypothetical protein ACRESK_07805 [Gammaproteobacteria bacterium]